MYAVTLEYFDKKTGYQAYGNKEVPQLVMASSPRMAAGLVHRIYNTPDNPVRVECYGHAVNVLMPKEWWDNGIPQEGKSE